VALSIALVVVITQKKTETIITIEPDHFRTIKAFSEPWQQGYPFSISSDYTKTKVYYYSAYTASDNFKYPKHFQELDKKVDFLGERVLCIPYKAYMQKRPYQTKKDKK